MSDNADFVNGRILVIDDNPTIHRDFEKVLVHELREDDLDDCRGAHPVRHGGAAESHPRFELSFALQGREGVALARQRSIDRKPFAVAFIDMRMPPGWDGLETIEKLWAIDPDVQVVVCSAHSDYDWTDFIERLGHSDKLLILKKPFEPIEALQCASALTRKWQDAQVLRRHVRALEQTVHARTEGLEAANRQLRHLATHDALTGLPNRVLLDDRLEQAIVHAQRDEHRFAVVMLDLDRFKLVNDSLGHRAGDELLSEMAQRLQARGARRRHRGAHRRRRIRARAVAARVACGAQAVAQKAVDAIRVTAQVTGVDLHVSAERRHRDVSRKAGRPRTVCSRTPTRRCTARRIADAIRSSTSNPAWTALRASA